MKEDDIWDWQCKMHMWSCFLYEIGGNAPLSDSSYDQLCQMLLRRYAKLPQWYRDRVSEGDLSTGTGSAIAWDMSDAEAAEARWWRDTHIPEMRLQQVDPLS